MGSAAAIRRADALYLNSDARSHPLIRPKHLLLGTCSSLAVRRASSGPRGSAMPICDPCKWVVASIYKLVQTILIRRGKSPTVSQDGWAADFLSVWAPGSDKLLWRFTFRKRAIVICNGAGSFNRTATRIQQELLCDVDASGGSSSFSRWLGQIATAFQQFVSNTATLQPYEMCVCFTCPVDPYNHDPVPVDNWMRVHCGHF